MHKQEDSKKNVKTINKELTWWLLGNVETSQRPICRTQGPTSASMT